MPGTQRGRAAFTLIELLLVIGIIALLMAILVPSMGSAIRAAKVTETRSRIDSLAAAIREYHRTFSALPLHTSPKMSMDKDADNSYPVYCYPSGDEAYYIFNHGQWNDRPFGGKFLAYFMMGPRGTGWHRPRTSSSNDPDYRNRYISAEWDVPEGITSFLENRPVSTGCPTSVAFPCFVDAFGRAGNNGGVIGYIRANSLYADQSDKFTENNGPLHGAFYNDCRYHPSYPGDGKFVETLTRILDQCPYDFALVSPGADRKYGYRVTVMQHNGEWMKGSWSRLDIGLCDDIANFPIE